MLETIRMVCLLGLAGRLYGEGVVWLGGLMEPVISPGMILPTSNPYFFTALVGTLTDGILGSGQEAVIVGSVDDEQNQYIRGPNLVL